MAAVLDGKDVIDFAEGAVKFNAFVDAPDVAK